MTIWQFFTALRAARVEWEFHPDFKTTIRSTEPRVGYCPLEAVAIDRGWTRTDRHINYITAAAYLGLAARHAHPIATVADGMTVGRPGLRRRLLRSCGLTEPTGETQ